jgi:hypothetical protein
VVAHDEAVVVGLQVLLRGRVLHLFGKPGPLFNDFTDRGVVAFWLVEIQGVLEVF